MKRENNKKFKKRKRNQNRSLTCRVLSMMFAIVLFCSTVLINTDYVSQASSFDDMVDMVEVEEDSAAVDTSEDTGDDLGTDVNFESEESTDETYSESEDLGSSDADFSSGENMFTDGTSESSAPAEETAQPVSCIVNLKNETIEIKAEAPAGVLPNGTQMIVKAVENNTEDAELTDQYNKLAAKITEQLQSQGKNLDGFLAYNVSFTDADGNPVEPSDKVTYSFTYKEASSPELTDPAASTVTAAMIRTNKETSELELTELKAEEDQLTVETNESRQLTKAAFQSAATAAFTFVWSSTPAADDNENNENKEENGEVNNEEVNADTNTENTEENGEETNTENNVENSEEEQNPEEAPDQEQTKMIRIITDEVNLRVAPSTEAEVIATVATDTQLPLIETVPGEDEFTWYKVSYEEAEAYVRSDMAEVVETEEQGTENEDANEEEADVQVEDEVTYSQTIDNVVVTATAAKDVLPEDAQFVVTPIKNDNAQYEDIAVRLEEKAENEEYSIAGFLAYDIYFLNNAGEKINPEDGKVKISMEYQNATAPEEVKESDAVQMDAEEEETSQENTEAKELSVSVMHFVEENGEVTSVVDMTKENSAAVETNEAGEVQKAEFETESFSTFTITWKYTQNGNTYNKNLTVHLVYLDNGQYVGISDTVNEYEENINNGENIELANLANEYKVEGYAYEKALTQNKTTEISSISYNSNSQKTKGWFYKEKDKDSWTHATTNDDYDIYLVYNKLSVWIKDDIMNTGNLKLETDEATTNEINDAIKAGKEVTYTWLKSTDGGENYTPVERKRRGNNYNLSEDGKSLNVALDDGALNSKQTSVKYKAKITIKNGNDVNEMESEPFTNKYWNELQNGSFETPKITSGGINEQYTNEEYVAAGGVWQSTGRGTNGSGQAVDIEIVNTRASFQSSYGWHGTDKAYDGNQFAELNCEAPGALYQDVMTYAGETMNYWLSHRARGVYPNGGYIPGEKDTMYLVIMPTSTAMTAASGSELKTQGQLEEYLRSRLPGVNLDAEASGDGNQKSEILYNNDGILISRITSDDQSWQRILETDLYRSTSYLTRFFFMSGHTASGKDTVGNFLDKVGFSQQLPPVTEDEFTLQIKKSFEGLGSADINAVKNNIKFNITVKNGENTLSNADVEALLGKTSILGREMTLQSDGTLVYTFANKKITNNAAYEIIITEADAGLDGYSLTTTAQTSTQIGDAAPTVVEDSSVASIQRGETTAIVSFKNKYEENNYKNINFTKVWDDADNKYNTRPASLDVTLHATYTVNENGTTQTKTLDLTGKVTPDATTTLPVNNEWKCSWRVPVYHKLDNGTKVKIKYTVTEGENSSAYVYKAITNNGNAINGDGTTYTPQFSDTGLSTSTTSNKAPKKNVVSRMSTGLTNLFSGADATATTSNADTSSSNTLGEPAHRKYITYNEATSDYTLNLDVTGAKGSKPGVDVLFVIDTSGSMGTSPYNGSFGYGSGYYNLLPTVKSLLTGTNGIVNKIFARSGNVNSVAMVSFSNKNGTTTTDWYSTSGKETFKEKVNALNASGGTNWTYAMIKAQDLMSQKTNSGNEKVVVFLSDGKPTYSCYKNKNNKWVEYGHGNSTDDKYYEEAAKQVKGSLSTAKIYSVYLTSDTEEGMREFSKNVNNSELVDGTNLDSALTNILNKVIPTYKNVTITDQLSEYVDFVEDNPVITVTKKTASGQTSAMAGSAEYTASVNKETKTITVQLLNSGSLDDGATYTVSFKVKPSNQANTYYAESKSYPNTGDPNTGSTSAGQAGFYSNIDAGTKLQYQIDGTTDPIQTASYSKPVVQVTTHTLTYTKHWNRPASVTELTPDVVLNVTYTDGGTNTIYLTSENGYTFHEPVPVTRAIQNVTEETVENYTPSIVINEDRTSVDVTNNYNKITASSITVKKDWKGNGPQSPITVSLYRSTNDGEAEVYDTIQLSKDNHWTHTWRELETSKGSGSNLETYAYYVREEKIPANYSSNIVPKDNEDGSITFTITNTYDENCADENYYIANVLQTEQLHIQKTWDDNENTAGLRPTELNVTVDGADYTLNATDNWSKNVKILKKKVMLTEASESVPDYYQQVEPANISSVNDGVYVLFKNKLVSTSITVTKDWNDGDATGRPESVGYQLQYRRPGSSNWQNYDEADYITAEDNNGTTDWTTVINNLPAAFDYQVVEVLENDNYISTVTPSADGKTFTITNTLKWSAVKKSADDTNVGLSGAKFELKKDDVLYAKGTSGDGGAIAWEPGTVNGNTVDLNALDGEFKIYETQAPVGYMKNDAGWTVVFKNGLLKSLDGAESSTESSTEDGTKIKASAATGVVITLTNQKVYTLPSTGGSGIYWYMIGGMVLMSTAAWILYKNKCREVLGK